MNRLIHPMLLLSVVCLVQLRSTPAAEPAARELDLLKPPPTAQEGSAWKYYSEDPKSKLEDVWKSAEGVLVCKGEPLGYIYTRQTYTHFVLRLEWRVPADAKPHKGGVLVRMTGKHRIWPRSLEAQINHPDAGDFWGLDGYRLDGPAERKKTLTHKQFGLLTNLKKAAAAEKPLGQWSRDEITVKGDTVTLVINGRRVNQATGCDVVAGHVCLTAEGNEIQFRNVKLVPLDK